MTSTYYKTYTISKISQGFHTSDIGKLNSRIGQINGWQYVQRANDFYLPWEEFRNKDWAGAEPEAAWQAIQMSRLLKRQSTPIIDKDGNSYGFDAHRHVEFLHQIDLEFGGNMIGLSDFGQGDKKQLIRRNLIEESIASSKLEGANTSREAARRLLKEGRRPRDKSEQMIVNNHEAMRKIEADLKNAPLSLDILLDLHRQVTSNTLDDSTLEGKLRETLDKNGNRLKVMLPRDETTVAYIAPDKEFVEVQLPRLIKFANDQDDAGFIHPVFKAIMLHFWIGLLHPFEDGNGRLARIIFYWYMLRRGYWAFSYLSLSERILKSPKQYAMAYIYAEQDNYDLNYFIQYNVEKLQLARKSLQDYLKRKIGENKQQNRILESGHGLNHRQVKLLQHLLKNEERRTSVATHQNENVDIGYVTAVTDLKTLTAKGLLRKIKTGRNVMYVPTERAALLFK